MPKRTSTDNHAVRIGRSEDNVVDQKHLQHGRGFADHCGVDITENRSQFQKKVIAVLPADLDHRYQRTDRNTEKYGERGGWERVIFRPKDTQDNAVPESGHYKNSHKDSEAIP